MYGVPRGATLIALDVVGTAQQRKPNSITVRKNEKPPTQQQKRGPIFVFKRLYRNNLKHTANEVRI